MSKRRKTLSQNLVSVATAGLPEAVRRPLQSRWISRLIIVFIPILIATGIVQIKWNGNRPHVSVDRERAAQVKKEVQAKAEELKEDWETKSGDGVTQPLADIRERLMDLR